MAEGLPLQQVLEEIARTPGAAGPHDAVWFEKSLAQLIEHIAGHHRALSIESLARGAVLFELLAELEDQLSEARVPAQPEF